VSEERKVVCDDSVWCFVVVVLGSVASELGDCVHRRTGTGEKRMLVEEE